MTPQQKRQYWQSQLQAQADSGLSKATFCQRNDIRPSTFYYWASKLREETDVRQHQTIHPLVVSAPEDSAPEQGLTLTLPNGCQLTFPATLAPDTLQRFVAALTL